MGGFFKKILNWFIRNRENQIIDPMKYLIVGIGNMHPDYDGTRHNIGFEILDQLAIQSEKEFKNDTLGDLCEIKYKGRILVLLKPSTYVNRSGKAVRYWLQKKKIKTENLLVVVDDVNLDFGKIRMRPRGSDGGHNGLKDIQQYLGTQNYSRLRIGIGRDFHKGMQVDYVLGRWSEDQMKNLSEIIETAGNAVKGFCFAGIKQAMNQFNS